MKRRVFLGWLGVGSAAAVVAQVPATIAAPPCVYCGHVEDDHQDRGECSWAPCDCPAFNYVEQAYSLRDPFFSGEMGRIYGTRIIEDGDFANRRLARELRSTMQPMVRYRQFTRDKSVWQKTGDSLLFRKVRDT